MWVEMLAYAPKQQDEEIEEIYYPKTVDELELMSKI